jgi:hypothetical protein
MVLLFLAAVLAPSEPADLTTDPRLSKPIDICANAEAAPALCERLGKAAGVTLTASPAIKDDLVILYAPKRPAAEVMKKVAEHFDWEWTANGDGYELRPTATFWKEIKNWPLEHALSERGTRAADARKHRAEWEAIDFAAELRTCAQLERRIQDLEGLKDAERAKELEALASKLRSHDFRAQPFATFANSFMADMPNSGLVEATNGRVVYSTHPKGIQRPLSEAMRANLSRLLNRLGMQQRLMRQLRPREGQQREPMFTSPPSHDLAQVAQVRVVVGSGSLVEAFLLDSEGYVLNILASCAGGSPPSLTDPFRDESPESFSSGAINDTRLTSPLSWAPPPSEWSSSTSQSSKWLQEAASAGVDPLCRTAGDLTSLAKAGGVCLVADAYDSALGVGYEDPHDLKTALDQYSRTTDSHYDLTDGWVALRTDRWLYERSRQIPRDILFATVTHFERQGGLTFDQQAEFVSKLADYQCKSDLPRLMTMYLDDSNVALYRFWGALPSATRSMLRSGVPIAYTSLPANAKPSFANYLVVAGGMTAQIWGGCGFGGWSTFDEPEFQSISSEPSMPDPPAGLIWDTEITEVFPGVPGLDPTLRLTYVAMPGLWLHGASGSGQFACPKDLAQRLTESTGNLASIGETRWLAKNAVEDAYRFRVSVTPGRIYGCLRSGLVVGDDVPITLRAFPAGLKQRVRDHWEAQRKRKGPSDGGDSGIDPP